ncbi:mucin-2-like [Hypanus sabinus]|uniref:mucin-2-like n=1 Tax=Hypanus sabinus TaxID=79690 RepID=UPI0028C3CED1|nr:mucin-2-like [Hypanus sabinus]
MLNWLFMGALGSLLVANSSCIQDVKRDCNNVFHKEFNGRYQLDFKAAENLCRSLGTTLATLEQLKRAHAAGYEKCRYGWIQEQLVALPRVHAHPSCGRNHTGVYTISRPLSSKYDVFCYEDDKSCTLENSPTDIPTIPPHPVETEKQNFTTLSQNRMSTSLPTVTDLEPTTVPLAEDRGVFTGTTVGAAEPFAPVQTDPWTTAVLPLSETLTESASPSVRLTRLTSATAPGFTRKAILSLTRPEHLLNSLSGSPSTRTHTIGVVDGSGSAAGREPYSESTGQTPLTWDDHMTKPTSETDLPTTGSTALPSPPSLPLDDRQAVNLGTEAELRANHVTEIPFSAELQSEPEVGFATIRRTALPSPLASDSSPTLAATQERKEHTRLISEVPSELELVKAEPHSDSVSVTTGSTTPPSPPTAPVDNSLRYNKEVYSPKGESNSLNSHSDPTDFSEFQLSTEGDPESASGLFTSHRLTNLSFDPAAVTVLDTTWAPSSSPSSESRGQPADSGNTPEILDFSPTEIRLDHSTGLSNELRLAASASAETSVPFGESGSTSDILSLETQETATRFSQEITINIELATEPSSQPPDINTSKRTFDPPVGSTLQAVDFDLTRSVRPPDHSSAVAMPFVTTQEPVTSTLPPSPEVPPIVPSTIAKKEVNQVESSPHTTVQPTHTSPELSGTTEVYSTIVFGPTTSSPIATSQVYQVSSSTVGQEQKDLEPTTVPLAEDRGVFTGTTVGAAEPFAPVQTDPWTTAVLPLSETLTESASPSVRLTRLTSATAPGFTRKAILSLTRPEHLLNSLSGSPSTRTHTIGVVDGSGSAAGREPYSESTGQTPLTWDDHMTKPTSETDLPTTGSTALPSPPSLPLDDRQAVNLGTEAELRANHVTEIPFSAELQSEPEVGFATIRRTALPSPLASDSSPTLAATQERKEHTRLISEVPSELELVKAEPHSDSVSVTTGSTTPPSPPTAPVDNSLRYNKEVYSPKGESNSLNSHSDPTDFSEFQLSTEGDPESASGLFTSHRLTNLSFDPAAVTVLDTTWAPSSSPSSESRGQPADSGNTPEILDFSPTEIRLDHSTGLSNELRLAASASAETSVPFGESGSTSDILSLETQETATRFSQEITINIELATEPSSQPPDINTSKRTFDPPVGSTLQAVDFDLTRSVRPPDHSSAVAMPFVTTQEPVTSTLPPSPEVPPIVPSTTAKKKVNQVESSPHTTVQPTHTSPELSGTTEVYSTIVFGPTTSSPIATSQVYQVSSSTVGQEQKAQPNITKGSDNNLLPEKQPEPTAMGKKSAEAQLDWLIVAAIVVSLLIILLGGVMIIYSKRLCGRKKSLTITKPGEDGITAMEKGASNGRGEGAARQGELKAEAKESDEWIQLIDKNNLDIIPESTEAAKLMRRDESGELPNIEVTTTAQDQVNWS